MRVTIKANIVYLKNNLTTVLLYFQEFTNLVHRGYYSSKVLLQSTNNLISFCSPDCLAEPSEDLKHQTAPRHHHHQLFIVHCWTKGSLNLFQDSCDFAIRCQIIPAVFAISSRPLLSGPPISLILS